ncbi:putative Alpha/beta hydrolase fold-3 domain-containing protein [Seiridium unicorne]|uniref:Alpha/beta hydrolase fold-3 domain-containing protein n=1 Tax=Seiridium unicorne TaxID=138068 RepID=A0ABR2UFR0_9PEZI
MARTLWSYQLFKGEYFAIFFATTPLHLLALSIIYLFKSRRPVGQRSIRQCLARAYLKSWFQVLSATRHQGGAHLVPPGKAKERFVVIEPPSDDHFTGILTPGIVKPAPIKALWFPSPVRQTTAASSSDKKIVLHFPGGAYVLPLATNQIGQGISELMTQHMGATTFFVQYRITRAPDTRFPAAIQDGVTSYSYLLSLGIDPKRIIISGDSAGGNLAIALLTYTSQRTRARITSHTETHRKTLVPSLCQWAADEYLPQGNAEYEAEARPFFSPLHHPFETRVPLFLHAGTKEAFYDSIKEFSEEMTRVPGNRIRLHETELAPHDIILLHKMLGFTSETAIAVRDARCFFADIS